MLLGVDGCCCQQFEPPPRDGALRYPGRVLQVLCAGNLLPFLQRSAGPPRAHDPINVPGRNVREAAGSSTGARNEWDGPVEPTTAAGAAATATSLGTAGTARTPAATESVVIVYQSNFDFRFVSIRFVYQIARMHSLPPCTGMLGCVLNLLSILSSPLIHFAHIESDKQS